MIILVNIFMPNWRRSSHTTRSSSCTNFASFVIGMLFFYFIGLKVIQIITILNSVHIKSPIELACYGPKIDCIIFSNASRIIVTKSYMCFGKIILLVISLNFLFIYPIIIIEIYGSNFSIDKIKGSHIIKNGLIFCIVFRTYETQSKKRINRLLILIFHDTVEFK